MQFEVITQTNNMSDFLKNTARPQDDISQEKVNPLKQVINEGKTVMGSLPSSYYGHNTGIGDSKYDKGLRVETMLGQDFSDDLADYRSKHQPTALKVGAIPLKVASKIGTELLKIPGFLGGGAAAIGNELFGSGEGSMDMFINNQWVNAIKGLEDKINTDVLPVYTKKSVKYGNLIDNITSIDFWANEGADGLAFMLAMFAPGLLINKVGAGARIGSLLGKTQRGTKLLNKVDEASKLLGVENTAQAIDLGLSTTVNTIFEAAEEANGAGDEIDQKLAQAVRNGEMTQEEANAERGRLMRDVFVSNLGILLIPNMILNKQLLRLGKSPQLIGEKYILEGANKSIALKPITDKNLAKKIWDYTYNVIGKNTVREGFFEEGMQSAVTEYWQNNEEFNAEELMRTYFDVLKTTEGQKAVLLGGIFGSVAGTVGKYMESKEKKIQDNALLASMNSSISFLESSLTGFVKKDKDGKPMMDKEGKPIYDIDKLHNSAKSVQAIQELNERLNLARQEGNVNEYKLIRDILDNKTLLPFVKAGKDGLNILRERLRQSKAFEEEINKANKSFNLDTTIDNEADNMIIKADELLKDLNFFSTYGKVLAGFRVTKENKDAYNAFINMLQNNYADVMSQKRITKKIITELQGNKADIQQAFSLNLQDEEFTGNVLTESIDEQIKEYSDYENYLNQKVKDILNGSKQKEAFKVFLGIAEDAEKVDEEVKTVKEETPDKEQEQEFEAVKEDVDTVAEAEKVQTKKATEAKKQSTEFFEALKDLYDNPDNYDLIFDEKSETVKNLFEGPYIERLKRFIPNVNADDDIKISKSSDEFNNDTYTIEHTKFNRYNEVESRDIIVVEKYETDEVVEEPMPTDDDINNNDEVFDPTVNIQQVSDSVTEQIKEQTNTKVARDVQKVHVKTVVSQDTNFTSGTFKSYRENGKNKRGEKVTFSIGAAGSNNLANEAIVLFQKLMENKAVGITSEQKESLIKHLPIRLTFPEGQYTQLFNEDGTGRFELDTKEYELRKQLVEYALKGRNSFEGATSDVAFQFPGGIMTEKVDGRPAENSVLRLFGIKSVDDVQFAYSDKYFDIKRINNKDGEPFGKAKHRGSIYMIVNMANGREFPLKLNLRRINAVEADIISKVVEQLINPKVRIQYKNNFYGLEDVFKFTEVELDYIKSEAQALGKNYNNLTISDLFSSLIFEGNSSENLFKVSGKILEMGNRRISSENFKSEEQNIKDWLVGSKNRNIKISKLNERDYKNRVLDDILTTDAILGEPIFQQKTDIYINASINVVEDNKKDSSEVQDSLRKRKSKKAKKGDLKNKIKRNIDDMNKEDEAGTIY